MAHISSLQAGIFSYLDLYTGSSLTKDEATESEFKALFATANASDVTRMPSVREFPSIGTPANIVNVPVYGQNISSQVQGQADAPSLEVTVNYVPEDMDVEIHGLIGTPAAVRFLMCTAATSVADSLVVTNANENTEFYFQGRIEAILVNPQLTDATTATVTLSTQSDFYGPFTRAAS